MEIRSGKDIKLSACMMVKNEEKFLPQCLKSIKDLVDEIIVVDTGSEDKTVEIAESFGARVFHHPWQNNFSVHRNQSLDYATGDWLFIIDADEEMFFDAGYDKNHLKDWLAGMPETSDAAAISLHDVQGGSVVMKFNTARFFRKGKVRYEGAVHNQPQVHGTGYLYAHMYLKHYGYDLSPEEMDRKEQRTKGLLLERIKSNPKDYLALFYLCQISATRGHREDCVKYGEEYVKHKEEALKEDNFNPCVYYTVAMNLIKLNDVEKADEWIKMGLDDIPNDLDLNFAVFQVGLLTRNRDRMIVGARRYMKAYEDLQRDPGVNQGRFTYTLNFDALSHVVYNTMIIELSDGFNLIKVLEQTLPYCSEDNRKSITEGLKTALKPYGFEIAINAKEGNDKKEKSVGLPSEELMKELMEE